MSDPIQGPDHGRTRAQPLRRPLQAVGLLTGAAILVPLVLLLNRYGPGDMDRGAAVGGGIALAGFAVAAWRAMRRPESTTSLDRAFTRTGDERDDAVLTAALAVVGIVSPPASAIATAAVATVAAIATAVAA